MKYPRVGNEQLTSLNVQTLLSYKYIFAKHPLILPYFSSQIQPLLYLEGESVLLIYVHPFH